MNITLDEIRSKAPEGATHYDDEYKDPYMVDGRDVSYWWRGDWFYFCDIDLLDNLDIQLKPL